MDKATKSFEEKKSVIDKIQHPRKRKDRNTVSHSLRDIDLPPIVNSFSPCINKHKQPQKLIQTITGSFKGTIQSELDSIINDTLKNFKHERINKIIFTSPITNRLGKTFYRPLEQPSVYDIGRSKHHNFKKNIFLQQLDSERMSLNASLIGVSKELEQPYMLAFKDRKVEMQEQANNKFNRYQEKVVGNAHALTQRGHKREGLDILKKQLQKFKDNDRFSPWRDNQAEGQLTL